MTAPSRNTLLPAPVSGLPDLRVARVETAEEMDQALDVRRAVFAVEQGVADLRVSDPDDARGLTVIASLRIRSGEASEWRAVSTGRLTPWPADAGPTLIAWVATLPEFRGLGIGAQVMRVLLDAADSAGIQLVMLAAQVPAERFYQRLGFRAAGPRYDVRGIPHVRMNRLRPH